MLTPKDLNRHVGNERGASIVLVAVSLVAILSMGALAVDLGMLLDSRSQAQRVADSAALAGASVFLEPEPPLDIVQAATDRAHEYGRNNTVRGAPVMPDDMIVEVLLDEDLVRVTVTRVDIPLWFARVFGVNESTVAATAAAQVQMSGSVDCLRPIAFADLWHEQSGDPVRFTTPTPSQPTCVLGWTSCDYYNAVETGRGHWWRNVSQPGEQTPYKTDDVGRLIRFHLNGNSGNFPVDSPERLYRNRYYPLDSGTGADSWRAGLAGEQCTGVISIGDPVTTEPGVQVGPTDQGLRDARGADPDAYWDDAADRIRGSRYPLGCSGNACTGEGSPRIFNVAMVHPVSRILANASADFEIQNFGAFFLERWRATGNESWIEVRWMKPTAVQDDCRVRGNCRDNLVLPLRLVE